MDSNNADNKRTKISRTGLMMYINLSLIHSYSKRQSTIETLVFVAEFVAIRVVVDTWYAIKYKLRMMSALIAGPTYICGCLLPKIPQSQNQHYRQSVLQ